MQNKGFVKFFSIALGLVCLFYLSFNVVSSYYDGQAKKYAKGDKMEEYRYLDSLSTEKVWMNYTLKECREKELSLGLDLKGGMNVILEVSVPDMLRNLADNTTDETFNKAMDLAIKRQATSQKDFLDLFQQAYEEIDKDARLAAIFSTFDLKDKINLKSTNDQVIAVIKDQVKATVDNSFNVLRTRIDRFGVVQPNIQRLETNGRILIELPGVKEPERVRKLLQGSANLEFWETYNLPEIYEALVSANTVVRDQIIKKDTAVKVAEKDTTAEKSVVDAKAGKGVDSLITQLDKKKETKQTDAQYKRENPLFSLLQLNVQQGQLIASPAVGIVNKRDTATVAKYLNSRQVKEVLPRDVLFRWTVKSLDKKGNFFQLIAIKVTNRDGKAPLAGDAVTDARDDISQYSAYSNVSMTMNPEGAKTWARLTKENIGRSIAIILDDMVYSYPNVNTEITGGRSEITGNFTPEEAKDLANVLKSGRMPAPSRIIQEDIVGPSLGQEAINQGVVSFIVAFVLIMLFMVVVYGWLPGVVVDAALLLNVFFLIGVLASFKAVLTLSGIAGIVLTLGMAVDANVLIYERIKEEIAAGKNQKQAVSDGYKHAFSAILDSNVTTLLTGLILFYFGTGPIKGFATTLIIGIITSFFTSFFVTHVVYVRMIEKNQLSNIPFTTKLFKNFLKDPKIDWIKIRKPGYIIAGLIALLAMTSLFTKGLEQGVDFTGGRNYVVRFENKVNTEDVKKLIEPSFRGTQISVITIGSENQVRISTNYKIADNSTAIDGEIETKLYESLKPLIKNQSVTNEMFIKGYMISGQGVASLIPESSHKSLGIQSSQKVGPSIAKDIKNSAYLAIIFAIIGIALYILLRFKNFSFSVGALVSLAYATLFVLGFYSLFSSVMPFSMEIGLDFVAAILTVIGYDVNDTVVIFDRIREMVGLYPKREKRELFNAALNDTLSRTFNTSLSVILVLIVMFVLGGETIRGFIFALLLGTSIGAFTSLFIASPLAYDIQRKRALKKGKN